MSSRWKAGRTAAFAASLAAWCGWGGMEVMGQADAWITSTAASNGSGNWTNMLGAPGSTVALPAPGGALGYNGQAARYSQHIRTNGSGQLIFFEVDGNLYDGDGYLIADARSATCGQCLAPGVLEFVSVPMPGQCGVYYLFSAVPRSATYDFSHVQVSVLDMNEPNPRFQQTGACNSFRGRLIGLLDFEAAGRYPGLAAWEFGSDYLIDPTAPNSLVVAKLPIDPNGKSQSPMLRVVQGAGPNAPSFLFAIMTTKTFVYRITANGVTLVSPVSGLGYLPTYSTNDPLTSKQYYRDADARLTASGEIRLVMTGSQGLQAFPFQSPLPPVYNMLAMRFNGSSGMLVPGSVQGWLIDPLPNPCGGPGGNSAGGLAGCALDPSANGAWYLAETTTDCSSWQPKLAHIEFATGIITDASAQVPGLQAYVRSRMYRNAGSGAAEAIYIPHAGGVASFQNTAVPGTISVNPTAISSAYPPLHVDPPGEASGNYQPRFLNAAVQGDTHLSAGNLATCCSYFQTVPGAVAGGYTRTAGQSNWNGANNEAQPGSSTVVFNCDVVVEPGGRLFASNMTWRFTNNAKVIVKPGGYLDLNNCTLTGTACYQARWPGVEVWGNAFYTQISTGIYQIPTYQGKLNAVNTTIENAQIGVLVSRRAAQTGLQASPYEGGGVVLMNGGTVRNCERGVDFRQYPWSWSTGGALPAPNQSRFTRTNFHLSQPQGGIFTFTAHARLDRVNGIQFKQCTFKNTVADAWYASGTNPLGSLRLGYGIESYESEFKVWPGCNAIIGLGQDCPAANVLPTLFEGLDHGIHALGGPNALRNFTVDRATFSKNICGVYSSGVIGFVAKRNNFSLGSRNVPLTNPDEFPAWFGRHRGIYSFSGYGFIVEDNTLVQAGTNPTEGIVIGLSKDHNDMVFRNSATNLERGYIGEGQCVDLDERAVKGLHFQCNQNTDNTTNFWARFVSGGGDAEDQSIRTNQGRSNRPADNTFDQEPGRIDFANDHCANNHISYWWANPDLPYKPIYVTVDPVTGACVTESNEVNGVPIPRPANNCASRLVRVPGPGPTPGMLAQAVVDEKLAYGNTRYLYQQLIDGGNRDEVLTEIMTSWPQDAWDLRAYLLGKSPFLTADVLKDVVNKAGFPMAMKAEVCIANPDATKKEGFIKWLEFEALYPMTPSMVASIVASWNAKTFRTQLENTLADHHTEMTQAANLWLEELSKDSINDPLDSLRMVWQQVRSQGARYAEAITYLQVGEWQAARNVVENIPQEHVMKGDEMGERGRMLALIDLMETVAGDNRTEDELTLAEQDALEAQMAPYADRPAVWAQNLLCFHYGRCTPPVTGGENEPKSALEVRKPFLTDEQPVLVVLPNPATTWATFDYTLPMEPENAWITIMDAQGRSMERLAVKQAAGQLVWDTREVAPGLYPVELVVNGQRLQSEKLIVKP